jgi:hypothetical protein
MRKLLFLALVSAFAKTADAQQSRPTKRATEVINPIDLGAMNDGQTDSGPAILKAIAAAEANGAPVIFPRSTRGYYLDGVFPELQLGEFHFRGNLFRGRGVGSPTTGGGTFNNQYTNPFNVTTDLKYIFDPAALPQKLPVTNIAMSIECAPNRPNQLNPNPNRNWVACVYRGADTGKGGAPGTQILTGVGNDVLNLDENSGTVYEIDMNVNGIVKDGGISRGIFLTGGGNPGRPFNSVALDIQHGAYDGSRLPWSTGISIRSSVFMLQMFKDSADEPGYFMQAFDQAGKPEFTLDKKGNMTAASVQSLGPIASSTALVRPAPAGALAACNRTTEGSQAAVTDSRNNDWGALVTGGGNLHVLAYCNGTHWTVAAR